MYHIDTLIHLYTLTHQYVQLPKLRGMQGKKPIFNGRKNESFS